MRKRTPTITSPRHVALIALLISEREKAGLTQHNVARRMGRYQSFVALVESGQRRVDVVEFTLFASAIGFNASEAIRRITRRPAR